MRETKGMESIPVSCFLLESFWSCFPLSYWGILYCWRPKMKFDKYKFQSLYGVTIKCFVIPSADGNESDNYPVHVCKCPAGVTCTILWDPVCVRYSFSTSDHSNECFCNLSIGYCLGIIIDSCHNVWSDLIMYHE